jgi:hypothetical protein
MIKGIRIKKRKNFKIQNTIDYYSSSRNIQSGLLGEIAQLIYFGIHF